MSLTPPATGYPDPAIMSTANADNAASIHFGASSSSSRAYGGANIAYFFPYVLRQRHTYNKAFWLNGAAVAGNVDVGIYTLSGTTLTRVVASTAEAQSGTNVMQVAATFTATTLNPGLYYLAISCTNAATATFWAAAWSTVAMGRLAGTFQATSSSPLPSSVTAAAPNTTALPIFGFSESTVI